MVAGPISVPASAISVDCRPISVVATDSPIVGPSHDSPMITYKQHPTTFDTDAPVSRGRPTPVGPFICSPSSPKHWSDVAGLFREFRHWLQTEADLDIDTEQAHFTQEMAAPADHYGTQRAVLFLAYDGELPLGMLGVRCAEDGTAELKRMYLRPIARGRGVADRLIERVIDHAASQRCRSLWLETLRGPMDPAIAVYRRNGFIALADRGRTVDVDGVVVMERPVEAHDRCA